MKKILLVVNGEKDWQDFLPDEKIKNSYASQRGSGFKHHESFLIDDSLLLKLLLFKSK